MVVCLGWVVLVGALGGALQTITGALREPSGAALAVIALPGLLSLILAAGVGPRRRAALLVAWAAAGACACGLTGGLSGPLTPWCLAPVAVAALIGRRRLMAEAAALAVMAAIWARAARTAPITARAAASAIKRRRPIRAATATGARHQGVSGPESPPVKPQAPAPAAAQATNRNARRRGPIPVASIRDNRPGRAITTRAAVVGSRKAPVMVCSAPPTAPTSRTQPRHTTAIARRSAWADVDRAADRAIAASAKGIRQRI